ncbi:hypothetical protein NQZ68_012002 [Dissostichus eleginoides]|nr:hypothetical protein NQZ68_012002 [Dissostichus eleginoides]
MESALQRFHHPNVRNQQLRSISSSGRSAAHVDQQLRSISPRQHGRTDSNPESERATAQAESKQSSHSEAPAQNDAKQPKNVLKAQQTN